MNFTPNRINAFNFFKLPSVWWCGIRVTKIDDVSCQVKVVHRWINQNPFKSMFWAVQGMAAEMPGGLLLSEKIKNSGHNISMLLIGSTSNFTKKAVGKILFTYENGPDLDKMVNDAVVTKEAQTLTILTKGIDQNGDVVSEFTFKWSIKLRSKK